MTGPKTPSKTLAAPDAPPLDLTPAEMRLFKAYRMMDNRAKRETLEDAEHLAMRWPHRTAPRLRLVSGGAP